MKPLLTALALLILVTVPAYAETFPLIGKALVCAGEDEKPEDYPRTDDYGLTHGWFMKFFKDRIEKEVVGFHEGTSFEPIPSATNERGEYIANSRGEYFTPPLYEEQESSLNWSFEAHDPHVSMGLYIRKISFRLRRVTLRLTITVAEAFEFDSEGPFYSTQEKLCRVITHEEFNRDLEKTYEDFLERRKI